MTHRVSCINSANPLQGTPYRDNDLVFQNFMLDEGRLDFDGAGVSVEMSGANIQVNPSTYIVKGTRDGAVGNTASNNNLYVKFDVITAETFTPTANGFVIARVFKSRIQEGAVTSITGQAEGDIEFVQVNTEAEIQAQIGNDFYVIIGQYTHVGTSVVAGKQSSINMRGGELKMNGGNISGLPTPLNDSDSTNKLYVDTEIAAAADPESIEQAVLNTLATTGAETLVTEELEIINNEFNVENPTTAPVASLPGSSGNVPAGTYTYRYYLTSESEAGRTAFTPESNSLVVSSAAQVEVSITDIPDNATDIHLYRNNTGGTIHGLLDTIPVETTYFSNAPTTELYTSSLSIYTNGSITNEQIGVHKLYFAYEKGSQYYIHDLLVEQELTAVNQFFSGGSYTTTSLNTDFPASVVVDGETLTTRVMICENPDGTFMIDTSPLFAGGTGITSFTTSAYGAALRVFNDSLNMASYPRISVTDIYGYSSTTNFTYTDDIATVTEDLSPSELAVEFSSKTLITNPLVTADRQLLLPNASGEILVSSSTRIYDGTTLLGNSNSSDTCSTSYQSNSITYSAATTKDRTYSYFTIYSPSRKASVKNVHLYINGVLTSSSVSEKTATTNGGLVSVALGTNIIDVGDVVTVEYEYKSDSCVAPLVSYLYMQKYVSLSYDIVNI